MRQKCHRSAALIWTTCWCLLSTPLTLHASLIESTIGTAVVNDATATYYNPAALTLVKNPQILSLNSFASFRSQFSGTLSQPATGFSETGRSANSTHYFLPSFYTALPCQQGRLTAGFGIIYNDFFRDVDQNAILRYAQSQSHVKNIDFIPALGFKLSEKLALGAGFSVSEVHMSLNPIVGFPGTLFPDSQSHDTSHATSIGGHAGILLKPTRATVVGFNYRSAVTYHMHGKSQLTNHPEVVSNRYHFVFWTPTRYVASINHFVTPTLGLMATIQYIQWSIFNRVKLHGVVTQIGSRIIIQPEAIAEYHLKNAWLFTVGGHYRVTPKWVIRLATTYNQGSSNPSYQIGSGDSVVLGVSTGYDFSKNISFDIGYGHAFIKRLHAHIIRRRNIIDGVNSSQRDALSLKVSVNFV